jgi:uridine kinase
MTGSRSEPIRQLIARIDAEVAVRPWPLIVSIDGRSGAGKSTLARAAEQVLAERSPKGAEQAAVTVVEGDDFYAGGDGAYWDAMTAEQKAANGMDWRRQRSLLIDLRARRPGRWYPFDWEAFDGRLATEPLTCRPSRVVMLEGAYTARPELTPLIDLRVLLDTPLEVSERQLRAREGDGYSQEWEARWRSAEDHYFGAVMPNDRFDLVLVPPA